MEQSPSLEGDSRGGGTWSGRGGGMPCDSITTLGSDIIGHFMAIERQLFCLKTFYNMTGVRICHQEGNCKKLSIPRSREKNWRGDQVQGGGTKRYGGPTLKGGQWLPPLPCPPSIRNPVTGGRKAVLQINPKFYEKQKSAKIFSFITFISIECRDEDEGYRRYDAILKKMSQEVLKENNYCFLQENFDT